MNNKVPQKPLPFSLEGHDLAPMAKVIRKHAPELLGPSRDFPMVFLGVLAIVVVIVAIVAWEPTPLRILGACLCLLSIVGLLVIAGWIDRSRSN